MKSRPLADVAVFAAPAVFVVLWSSGFIGSKAGLPHAEPMTFLALRTGLVCAVLGMIVLLTRPSWPGRAGFWHNVVAGLLMQGVYIGGVFVALKHGLPAGLAALVAALQPVLTSTLANRWLGEKVRPHQWIGLLLGLFGVFLVVQDKISGGGASLLSWIAIFVGLIGITIGTLYQKRFAGSVDWRTGLLIQFGATAAVAFAAALVFETRVIDWTPQFVATLAYLVFVLSIGAIWLLYFLIRRSAATRVVSLFYLTPVMTALMAWWMFDERLAPLALLGRAICVAGVFLVNWRAAA